jgi:hypothetical protein
VKNLEIAPAKGKLGILLVGLGAVSTTTIAGVLAVRKGLANPIGSLTQMGTIRLGKRTEGRSPKISEAVPLVNLDNVVFGGLGYFRRELVSRRAYGRRARDVAPRSDQARPRGHQADDGGVRSSAT